MRSTFVSIIIPTYNDWKRLALCVEALAQQSYPSDSFEVIIVNNNPNDDVPETFNVPAGFKIITEARSGSYAARNTGLLTAKGEIIGFTDSDCIPHPDWIKNAADHFTKHADCSRLGGKIEFYFRGPKPNDVELMDKFFYLQQHIYVSRYKMAATANLFCRREVFEKVGNFNTGLMSGGDLEWGRRARDAGFTIHYVTNVIVLHPARYTYKELLRKEKRLAGGHSQLASPEKGQYLKFTWRLVMSFKPNLKETIFIYQQKNLDVKSRMMIFLMRYHIQIVRALEKFKVNIGKSPERF